MNTYTSYQALIKPFWAPPAYLFGPVWTFLYILIAISFGKVFIMAYKKEIPAIVVLPFVLNLIFNFTYTPIQFGLKNNLLASIDILLILGTLVWAIIAVYRNLPRGALAWRGWIIYTQIPYFLWVSFATVLQLTITYLNW